LDRPGLRHEDEKARNTERMIREAIADDPLLQTLTIDVYAKGSYKNNTNVRRDSDVDIAVEYTGILYPTYDSETGSELVDRTQGLGPYTGRFRDSAGNTQIGEFKDAVGGALEKAFGKAAVTRHNKVFTVRESSRSLAADVVPCATHRHFWAPQRYAQGIHLLPDSPSLPLFNYPAQHYANGVAKNEATGRAVKRVVRILKNLENLMVSDGTSPEVASYLVECLVYNCPNSCFTGERWAGRVRAVLVHIWEDTEAVGCEARWLEVNEVKLLFHATQKWTREEARDFVHDAWQYVKDS
jgi:hypothetical protein